MILKDCTTGRNNNLDLIRFLAASLVIYSHSFPLTMGEAAADPLFRFSGGQMNFGNLAVCIFFLFSGFFITKSVLHRPKASDFFLARIKRLFPPLIVVVLLCVFVLGPVTTSLPVKDYFTNLNTWKYLGNIFLLLIHELPGVFQNNPYNPTVNGVLWTLPVEVLCYIACFLFQKLQLLDSRRMRYTIPVFVIPYIAAFFLLRQSPLLLSALRPCGMFYAGMLAYVYQDKIRLYPAAVAGGLVLFLIALRAGFLEQALLLALPYPLLYFCFGTPKKCSGFGRYGDFSYGMYLTAWPIAQCLVKYLGTGIPSFAHAVLTLALSVMCGALLHWFVERRIKA